MKRQFKVMRVAFKRKTILRRFDPTSVTKNVSIRVDRYYDTMMEACNRVEILREKDDLQSEMDHAWGAPPECFENMPSYDYYIVDREIGQWYDVYQGWYEEEEMYTGKTATRYEGVTRCKDSIYIPIDEDRYYELRETNRPEIQEGYVM